MSINALGQTIQLLLSSAQVHELTDGLTAGDQMRGRVVEVMPGDKAVVNFKGINVVAQLKADLAQALQKGDILTVKVTSLPSQAPLGPNAAPVPAALQVPANTLTLQLTQRVSPGQVKDITVQSLPLPPQAAAPVPVASRDLGAALRQINLPETSANLAAARALSDHGLPVTAVRVNQVVELASQMQNASVFSPDTAAAPQLPREVLTQAQALLSLLDQQTPTVQRHLEIQQALRSLQAIALPEAPPPTGPVQAAPPAALASAAPQVPAASGVPQNAQQAALALSEAIQQLAQAPDKPLAGLLKVLTGIQSYQLNPGTFSAPQPVRSETVMAGSVTELAMPAPATVSSDAPATPAPPAPAPPGSAPVPVLTPAQIKANLEIARALPQPARDMLVDVLGQAVQATPSKPASSAQIASSASQMAQDIQRPETPLFKAVQSLAQELAATATPASPVAPQEIPKLASQYLTRLAQEMKQAPVPEPVQSQASLVSTLTQRGFVPPLTTLSTLPRESVLEAVVFLQARGLPVTPAFVEPVALALTLQNGPVEQINTLKADLGQVGNKFIESRPALKEAVENFQKLFDSLAIRPESGKAAAQLEDLVLPSGLKLESRLAREVLNPLPIAADAPLDKTDLKASLLKLQREVAKVLSEPGLDAQTRVSVEKVSGQVQSALSSLTAQQLVNQPLASREWVSFHVPIWFGQAVVPGQLSVYWKKGATPQLNDVEPLNVVFNIDTRGLGPVKAFLAIYKSECFCQVRVRRQDALDLIQDHLGELKDSFGSNTPFKLSQLDVAMDATDAQTLFPETSLFAPAQGISLSA